LIGLLNLGTGKVLRIPEIVVLSFFSFLDTTKNRLLSGKLLQQLHVCVFLRRWRQRWRRCSQGL